MEELNIIHTVLNLGPSGILGFISYKLWDAYQKQLDYNRETDRNNLESINKIITFVDKLNESQKGGDGTTHELLKDIKNSLEIRTQAILDHLNKNK